MNLRKHVYFALVGLRGQALGAHYRHFLREAQEGVPPETTRRLLVQLLTHCERSVPFYAEIMRKRGYSFKEDPEKYLRSFPILTKDIIRAHFDELRSSDLANRKWYFNTSGGSTGEPVRFIQDRDYSARVGAIKLLYSRLVGKEIGEPEINLWGSSHDVAKYSRTLNAILVTNLTNIIQLNAFKMTPDTMRQYVEVINTRKPKQIVAYADSIYMLADFAERQGLEIVPQDSIITSAGMLYPVMRAKIEKVFQCRVFNRYGCREVSDIACERPDCEGLWVAPWGNYLEIVDKDGNPVPDGTEGEILVTSLTNYAMPFIRYRVGDLGILAPSRATELDPGIQILQSILGRTIETLKTKDGVLIHAGNFMVILFHRDWIARYQVIQRSYSHIVYRIVQVGAKPSQAELDDIMTKTRHVMGHDCKVTFDFVDHISVSPSGKHRYIFSEVRDLLS